jgi:chlorobactene glucosyltransferase
LSFWIQHQWSLVIFLGTLLVISLTNLWALRRLGGRPSTKRSPKVSVLVPARNEEQTIVPCVQSLLSQDYSNFEVLVLDDGSEDRTLELLRPFEKDPRFKALQGAPLPRGWLGKPWACHQLSQTASGEILLFVDADTTHHPRMLHDVVVALQTEGIDFLSALPHLKLVTWSEQLILPILPWSVHTFLPLLLVRRFFRRVFATAIGQFMIFRKAAYVAIGGHKAVRKSVAEDRALVRQVAQASLSWTLLDGKNRVSTRPYRGFTQVWQGLSKSLFATFGYKLPLFLFVWAWLFWVAWEPPSLLLLYGLRALLLPPAMIPAAAVATALLLLLWAISNLRFRLPLWQAALYPLTMLFMLLIALHSAVWHYLGRGKWKGRRL